MRGLGGFWAPVYLRTFLFISLLSCLGQVSCPLQTSVFSSLKGVVRSLSMSSTHLLHNTLPRDNTTVSYLQVC